MENLWDWSSASGRGGAGVVHQYLFGLRFRAFDTLRGCLALNCEAPEANGR